MKIFCAELITYRVTNLCSVFSVFIHFLHFLQSSNLLNTWYLDSANNRLNTRYPVKNDLCTYLVSMNLLYPHPESPAWTGHRLSLIASSDGYDCPTIGPDCECCDVSVKL